MNILDEIRNIRSEKTLDIDSKNANQYRVLVNEVDGVSAYYFSLPIYRETDKKLIDFKWKYDNNRTIFQGINAAVEIENNVILLKNDYGKATIIFNEDIELGPTVNGIAVNVIGGIAEFTLALDSEMQVRENDCCFALMKDEFMPFLVVSGIVGRVGKECVPLKVMGEKIGSTSFKIAVFCDERVDSMLFEIDLQAPKFIFDTTVESNNPDKNNAFGGIAFLGDTPQFGQQWLYSRFDTMQLIDLNNYLLKEANLYLPKFCDSNNLLETFKMTAAWCSFGSTWNTKTAFSELLHRSRQYKKYEIVEVSDVIRDILRLNEPRNPGVVIKGSGQGGYSVVSTGDNYLRPQILEIKLRKN